MWNYRIIEKTDRQGNKYYAMYEAFYNKDGTIYATTQEPCWPGGDTKEELIHELELMLKDARRLPVLIEPIQYSTPDWEKKSRAKAKKAAKRKA